LTASPVSSSRIDLAWTDASINESGFTVEQAVGEAAFVGIAQLPPNSVALSVTGLMPPATYRFRVRAHNPDGLSPYSNTVSTQTAFVDLVMTAVSDPPAALTPASRLSIVSTVLNQGSILATSFKVRYYVSRDQVRSPDDLLLSGGVSYSKLAAKASATSTVSVTLPAATPLATYYVLACPDDGKSVTESDEGNNCRASAKSLVVGRPDLVITALADPPLTVVRGARFTVRDTVSNLGTAPAGVSRTRYYVSVDQIKGSGDRVLSGARSVSALAPGATGTGSITVTVPSSTVPGQYWLLACADDTRAVVETDETNNCVPSSRRLSVTP
jgi:subtilase family serine protease